MAAEQFKKLQEEDDDYENEGFTSVEKQNKERSKLLKTDDDEVVSHEHTHTNSSGDERSPKAKKKKAAKGLSSKKSNLPKGVKNPAGAQGKTLNPASDDEKYSSEHYSEDYSSVNNKSNNQFDASAITKEVVNA